MAISVRIQTPPRREGKVKDMNIVIELTEHDVKRLVCDELQRRMGDIQLEANDVKIETKSSQNYKSEWETAHFRARINVSR